MTGNCSIAGLYSGFQQQYGSGQSSIYQYGIYIGLGSPSLNASLWPSVIHNETSFRTADFCSASTNIECAGSSDPNTPVTYPASWQNDSTYQSLDDLSLYDDLPIQYGSDTLRVWTNYIGNEATSAANLQDFSVTLVSNSNHSSNSNSVLGPGDTIGLGQSSTLLDALYKQNVIASRSYGLYVGTSTSGFFGLENGSLVLGGYDSAAFIGPVLTYNQVPASSANGFSSFKVNIAQMTLDTAPDQSLDLTGQVGFDAYLTTAQYAVQFPQSITQKFAEAVGAVPANNTENTLHIPDGFSGNLTVTLADGFKVTFNSSWLSTTLGDSPISAAPIHHANTGLSSSNSTVTNELPIMLGLAFLQQLYLFVSHDASPPTFSIAQAITNPAFFQQEPLCPGTVPNPFQVPHINQFLQQGLVGAVIGGVIGGSAIVVFFFFLIRFWVRRRSTNPNPTGPNSDIEDSNPPGMRESINRKFRSGKSVKFLSGSALVTPRGTRKFPVTLNQSSDVDSSLEVLDPKDAYVETRELASLRFGFSSKSLHHQVARDSQNPYRHSRFERSKWRSSSVYSGE